MVYFHLVHVRLTRLLFRSVFSTHPSLPLEEREVVFVYRSFSISFWGDCEFNNTSLRDKEMVCQFHCFEGN